MSADHFPGHVNHTVRETPFIIIPAEQFCEASRYHGHSGIEHGGVSITCDIVGNIIDSNNFYIRTLSSSSKPGLGFCLRPVSNLLNAYFCFRVLRCVPIRVYHFGDTSLDFGKAHPFHIATYPEFIITIVTFEPII